MINKIYVNKIISDKEIKDLEGNWIDKSYIKKNGLINKDTDVLIKEKNKDIVIAKFRKKAINKELCELGWDNYKSAATPSRGRGASAGLIDINNTYWKKRIPVKTSKWSTSYIVGGKVSKMKVNNQVASNVLGYYEGTPWLKLPPRMTNFTRTKFNNFKKGLPFIQKMNDLYEQLTPEVFTKQLQRAGARNYLRIPNTAFSSVTVNRNFRTALHVDAGNLNGGMAVMTVLERGKYSGGYTVFPQYGIGFDVRHGDILVMENCNTWHANTEIEESQSQKKYNENMKDIFNDNPEVGTAGLDKKYTRLTFVCYLREKLLDSPKSQKGNKFILDYNQDKNQKHIKKTKKNRNNKI